MGESMEGGIVGDSAKLQNACATAKRLLSLPMDTTGSTARPDKLSMNLHVRNSNSRRGEKEARGDAQQQLSASEHGSDFNRRKKSLLGSCSERLRVSIRKLKVEDTCLQQDDDNMGASSYFPKADLPKVTDGIFQPDAKLKIKLRRSSSAVASTSSTRSSQNNPNVMDTGSSSRHAVVVVGKSKNLDDSSRDRLYQSLGNLLIEDGGESEASETTRRLSVSAGSRIRRASSYLSNSSSGRRRRTMRRSPRPCVDRSRRGSLSGSSSGRRGSLSSSSSGTRTSRPDLATLLRVAEKRSQGNFKCILEDMNVTGTKQSKNAEWTSQTKLPKDGGIKDNRALVDVSSTSLLEAPSNSAVGVTHVEEYAKSQPERHSRKNRSRANRALKEDLPDLMTGASKDSGEINVNRLSSKRSLSDLNNLLKTAKPSSRNSNADLMKILRSTTLPANTKSVSNLRQLMHAKKSPTNTLTNFCSKRSQSDLNSLLLKASTRSSKVSSSNLKKLMRSSTLPAQDCSVTEVKKLLRTKSSSDSKKRGLTSKASLSDLNNVLKSAKPASKRSNSGRMTLLKASAAQVNRNASDLRASSSPKEPAFRENSLSDPSTLWRANDRESGEKNPSDLRKLSRDNSISSISDLNRRQNEEERDGEASISIIDVPGDKTPNSNKRESCKHRNASDLKTLVNGQPSLKPNRNASKNYLSGADLYLSCDSDSGSDDDDRSKQSGLLPASLTHKRSSTNRLDLLNASMTHLMNASNSSLLEDSLHRPSTSGRRKSNHSSILNPSGASKKGSRKKPKGRGLSSRPLEDTSTSQEQSKTEKEKGIARQPSLHNKLELLASMNRSQRTINPSNSRSALASVTNNGLARNSSLHQKLGRLAVLSKTNCSARPVAVSCANLGALRAGSTSMSNGVKQMSTSQMLQHAASLRSKGALGSQMSLTPTDGDPTQNAASSQKNVNWSTFQSKLPPPHFNIQAGSAAPNRAKGNPFASIVDSSLPQSPLTLRKAVANPFASIVSDSLAAGGSGRNAQLSSSSNIEAFLKTSAEAKQNEVVSSGKGAGGGKPAVLSALAGLP